MVAKITYKNEDFESLEKANPAVAAFADEYRNEGFSDDNDDGTFTWEFDFRDGDSLVMTALDAFRKDSRFVVECVA